MLDPDEALHPARRFDWGTPEIPERQYCQCLLCAPPCRKEVATGAKWCALCFGGHHLWAEAPCGSPFHYDLLESCPCMDPNPGVVD